MERLIPPDPEPRFIAQVIGRDLRWWERWEVNLRLAGWRILPYWAFVALGCTLLPAAMLSFLLEWAGLGLRWAVKGVAGWFRPEEYPWSLRDGEDRNLLKNERVMNILDRMGLVDEEDRL